MSSELQLNVRHLNRWWLHLVNSYEVKTQAWRKVIFCILYLYFIFCKPLVSLFNKSLPTSSVPRQWKSASILPVPKIPLPLDLADLRPISITPVLSRTLKRNVVREFLYPAIYPPTSLSFCRSIRPPSYRVHRRSAYCSISDSHRYHGNWPICYCNCTRLFKGLNIMLYLARWPCWTSQIRFIIGWWTFFTDRKHCTIFQGLTSEVLDISASIIHGSAIGPVSYVINASDLSSCDTRKFVAQVGAYADDTYIVIPARNAQSREDELDHVAEWA